MNASAPASPPALQFGQLTTITEANPTVTSTTKEAPLPSPDYTHPYDHNDMSQILTRTYKVAEFQWDSTDVSTSALTVVSFPAALFAIPNISSKLEQFEWIRAGVEVTVKLNATEFHNGALLVSTAPHYNGQDTSLLLPSCGHMYQRAQLADATVLEASSTNSCTLNIERVGPRLYEDAHGLGGGEIGQLFIDCLHPLRNQAGSVPAPVTVSIFARFTNPIVAGFTATPSSPAEIRQRVKRLQYRRNAPDATEHMSDPSRESQQKSSSGLLSGVAEAMSSFTPLIAASPLAELAPFTGLAGIAAPFLKSMGLDKPTTQMAPQPIYIDQYANAVHGHGLSPTPKLALHPEAGLGATKVNGMEQWMVQDIIKRPGLVAIGSFNKTLPVDTPFLHFPVTPMMAVSTGLDPINFYPTYMAYMSQLFTKWRGSIKFHIKFSSAKFTTARVRITHLPNDLVPGSFEAYAGDMSSAIVDVRGSTEYSFSCPYYNEYEYQNTFGLYAPQLVGVANVDNPAPFGILPHLVMTLVNPVAAPTATDDTTIYYTLWASAGEDFHFGHFRGHMFYETQYIESETPAKKRDVDVEDIEDLPRVLARHKVLRESARRPTSSSSKATEHMLASAFSKPFKGLTHARGSFEVGSVLPEKYSSLYDLLHRFEVVRIPSDANQLTNYTNLLAYQGLETVEVNGFIPTIVFLARLFAFWRGGLRYMQDPINTYLSDAAAVQQFTDYPTYLVQNGQAPLSARVCVNPGYAFEVPFQSNGQCIPLVGDFPADFYGVPPVLKVPNATDFTTILFSVAEDFQFGLLRPPPVQGQFIFGGGLSKK